MFDSAAVPSSVVLRERHTGGTRTVLEIEHDGSAPPEALLAELRAAGWAGAVPVPPPATAVDWSTPDPVTGNRYSVRPHRAVVHATLEGPAEQRATAVAAAHAAAARLHPVDPIRPTDLADAASSIHEITCSAGNAPLVRAAAAAIGTVLDERAEFESVTMWFRGNSTERMDEVRRLRLLVRGASAEDVRRRLVGTGVRSVVPASGAALGSTSAAAPTPVALAAGTEPEAAAPTAEGRPVADPRASLYEVVCTAANAAAVRAAAAQLGTVVDDRSESEVVTVRFRGNSTEQVQELRRMRLAASAGIDEVRAGLVGTGVRSLEPVA